MGVGKLTDIKPYVKEFYPQEEVLNEVRRALKSDGRLAIIECKKQDQPFDPPKYMHLSPEEIEGLTESCGFEIIGFTDLGYNYLIQFGPTGNS